MNNIGEYTGDADDVLNRHESCYDRRGMLIQGDYHPISYPDWSDNQWKGIWHRYSKYLNDAKRKELSEQQAQQARDARENLRIEQLRNTLQLRVSYLIGQIVQKKEVQHTKYIKDKENRAFAAQYGSGNSKKAMELIKYNRNAFAECSNHELI